jgi:tetratricopeptide (TPR) repeat protein
MIRYRNTLAAFGCALFILGPQLSQAQHDLHEDQPPITVNRDIGVVDFQVSCDAGVVDDFDHALGMMHHMMYEQARSEFQEIAKADESCAMAYWGIATTLFQPLWDTRPSAVDLERGWRMIQTAQRLGPPTEREQALVEATGAFFREPGVAGYRQRLERWANGMAAAYRAHPNDLDIAALYSLSRLALGQLAEDRDPLHDEAEKILRHIWEQEPEHPGALHYSLHATDVDGRAGNALDMVEAYGKLAPEVPHALHMPSHIYVRKGDWLKVIEWNRRSANVALGHHVNRHLSHHYIHALDYILYAVLQQGNDEKAYEVYKESIAGDRHQDTFVGSFHAAAMPARLAVEGRDWEAASQLEPRSPDYFSWDDYPWAEGMGWFARGLGAVQRLDLPEARISVEQLSALQALATERGDEHIATFINVDRHILAGWVAYAESDGDEAIRLMSAAAELEGTVEKHPVTPGALMPPNEALGLLLLDLNEPEQALEAFQNADDRWPNRYHTLLGAARAAREAGNEEVATEYYQQLLDMVVDSERDGVREAREFVND